VEFIENQIVEFDDRNKTDFESEFVPPIRVSFLMALVAQMEHHLKKVCDVVAEKRNLDVRSTDLKGANGFESCVAYLKKVLQVRLPEVDLKVVRSIVELRNAWVHQGGYVDALPRNLGPTAAQVDKTAGGQISFGGGFFQEASRVCESFVEAVVDAITEKSASWQNPKKARHRSDDR